MENIMHGNLEPEESVWNTEPNTYTVHPEMADVDLNTEELLSVNFETKKDVDVVFTVDPSFQELSHHIQVLQRFLLGFCKPICQVFAY